VFAMINFFTKCPEYNINDRRLVVFIRDILPFLIIRKLISTAGKPTVAPLVKPFRMGDISKRFS
jgi:hypothetical protein